MKFSKLFSGNLSSGCQFGLLCHCELKLCSGFRNVLQSPYKKIHFTDFTMSLSHAWLMVTWPKTCIHAKWSVLFKIGSNTSNRNTCVDYLVDGRMPLPLKWPFLEFSKLGCPFFSLKLLAWLGLRCFGECNIVFSGYRFLMNTFSIW